MKYTVSVVFILCIVMVSPAFAYHNCAEEPEMKKKLVEVVCRVIKWPMPHSEWSRFPTTFKSIGSRVICVNASNGFIMQFTIPANHALQDVIFVKNPTKLEVCIQPHP